MEWFDIKGYEGFYQVNRNGDIKSVEKDVKTKHGSFLHRKERLLKPTINDKGYMKVYLSKYGISENLYVHRIVAETFIENSDNLPQVNHINGDKTDNRVENLEWVSAKENVQHAIKNGLFGRWKEVV